MGVGLDRAECVGDVRGERLRRLDSGLIAGLTELRLNMDPALRTGLTVGVLGGYTTFSTLMYESTRQMETRALWQAGANLGGRDVLGLAAMMLGLAIGRAA